MGFNSAFKGLTGREGPEGSSMALFFYLNSALEGCGWLTPRPDHFTSWTDPVPVVAYRRLIPGVHLSLNPVATGGSFSGATVSPYSFEVRNMWCYPLLPFFSLFVSHKARGIFCVYRDIGLCQRYGWEAQTGAVIVLWKRCCLLAVLKRNIFK